MAAIFFHIRDSNATSNPVVVHTSQAYKQYLHHIYHIAPFGFALLAGKAALFKLQKFGANFAPNTDAPLFIVLYGATAYYFCTKVQYHPPLSPPHPSPRKCFQFIPLKRFVKMRFE